MSIEQERQAHYHTLIAIHRANLQRLEEQRAHYGIAVPLDLAASIAYEEQAIQTLTQAIASLIPASVAAELGQDGQFLVLSKQLDMLKARERQREMIDLESRSRRQRHNDIVLYLIVTLLVIDIVLRFVR